MINDLLTTLHKVCEAKGGIKPAFNEYHVIKALMVIKEEQPIGRPTLSKRLKLGESSTKNLIRRLHIQGLIEVDPVAGAYLTSKGLRLAEQVKNLLRFIDIDVSPLVNWSTYVSALIKGGYELVKKCGGILWLRDVVIKNGGDACLIITVKGGKLVLPSPNEEFIIEGKLGGLITKLGLNEGDLVLVVKGKDTHTAEEALVLSFINLLECGG